MFWKKQLCKITYGNVYERMDTKNNNLYYIFNINNFHE